MTPPYTLFSVATLLLLVGCSEGFSAARPSPESPPDPTWDTAAPDTAVLETGDSAAVDSADSGDSSPPPEQEFWHIERPGDSARTWLVSPEGARTFVLGVNTVMRDVTCDGILDTYIRRMEPSRAANREWARLATGSSGGEEVEQPYCFNSVGAFSESNDFDETGGDSYMIRPAAEGGARGRAITRGRTSWSSRRRGPARCPTSTTATSSAATISRTSSTTRCSPSGSAP